MREGSFSSVAELTRSIETYLAERNADSKPYRRKAEGAEILDKIARARDAPIKTSQFNDRTLVAPSAQ